MGTPNFFPDPCSSWQSFWNMNTKILSAWIRIWKKIRGTYWLFLRSLLFLTTVFGNTFFLIFLSKKHFSQFFSKTLTNFDILVKVFSSKLFGQIMSKGQKTSFIFGSHKSALQTLGYHSAKKLGKRLKNAEKLKI